MCHALLQNPNFFQLLLQIDIELAAQARSVGCRCGGALHRANYPRKPRCCPDEARADYESRFSFCCSQCRKRTTSMSVRFLGRRVYLGLAVVLMSAGRTDAPAAVAQLGEVLQVPARTIQRWRRWWVEQFPLTPLWQAACARFMPPVDLGLLPASLIERFAGVAEEPMRRILIFLSPLTVGYPVTLNGGC
ncbi:MAG: hypothetical protein CO070_00120 [Gallionellales bacterium CG_4_9_14_0_8_um_filter_55_61]|nr:MAG: hypothetical protein CO070_00120 [Gallionellales bacterium CG_4_9_14_0_8_um_filter_55_61]